MYSFKSAYNCVNLPNLNLTLNRGNCKTESVEFSMGLYDNKMKLKDHGVILYTFVSSCYNSPDQHHFQHLLCLLRTIEDLQYLRNFEFHVCKGHHNDVNFLFQIPIYIRTEFVMAWIYDNKLVIVRIYNKIIP